MAIKKLFQRFSVPVSELDQARLRGARGDLSTALSWYRRARDLGVAEAEILLKSLETK